MSGTNKPSCVHIVPNTDTGGFIALEDPGPSLIAELAPTDSTRARSLRMSTRVMPITCAKVSSSSTWPRVVEMVGVVNGMCPNE